MHFRHASSARARPCVGRHLRPYGTGYCRVRGRRRRCGLRGAETGETGRECSKCFKPRGATKQNRRVVSRHSAPPHTGPPVTPHVTSHPSPRGRVLTVRHPACGERTHDGGATRDTTERPRSATRVTTPHRTRLDVTSRAHAAPRNQSRALEQTHNTTRGSAEPVRA